MQPAFKVQCPKCGMIWGLDKVGSVSDLPARFCPSCGNDGLTVVKSSFVDLEAPCFKAWPKELVQLLYEGWNSVSQKEARAKYPTLLLFIAAVLAGETPTPDWGTSEDEEETPNA